MMGAVKTAQKRGLDSPLFYFLMCCPVTVRATQSKTAMHETNSYWLYVEDIAPT